MCNINAFFKNQPKSFTPDEVQAITGASFVNNPHSEGAFLNKKIVKSLTKINFTKYQEEIKKTPLLVTHERLATTGGINLTNAHPIKINKNYYLAHNGVLSNLGNNLLSDSFVFAKTLKENFKTMEISKAIENFTSNHHGSYSVIIFNTNGQEAYYFKNESTNISLYRLNDNSFFLTTSTINQNIIYEKILKEIELPDKILFRFWYEGKRWKMRSLGKLHFKELTPVTTYSKGWNWKNKNGLYLDNYNDYWNGYSWKNKWRKK